MFTKENILPIAEKADYGVEFINEIGEYLDFVAENPDLLRELEKYYNTLFVNDDIFPIIKVESMPLPRKSEEKYKGFFELVIYF